MKSPPPATVGRSSLEKTGGVVLEGGGVEDDVERGRVQRVDPTGAHSVEELLVRGACQSVDVEAGVRGELDRETAYATGPSGDEQRATRGRSDDLQRLGGGERVHSDHCGVQRVEPRRHECAIAGGDDHAVG